MIRKFTREISSSQSQFKAQIERKYVTQQCSYNLPIELEDHLRALGAIAKANPNEPETNAKYFLTNGYSLVLGANIIAAIGESYKKVDNRVVFTHTEGSNGTSKKIQLKKTDFKNFGKSEYKWFVELYEKNLESTLIVVFVDDEKKTVTIDLELTPYFFSGNPMPEEEEAFVEEVETVVEPDWNKSVCFGDEKTISEEDFREWLSAQVKKNGDQLSDEYQNAYYYILKSIPSMLGATDVFDIKTVDKFDAYRIELEGSTEYQEVNPNIGAGTLSAALTKYRKYLVERSSDVLPIEVLVRILRTWCDEKPVKGNITSTLVAFGFKYAESIKASNKSSENLLVLAGVEEKMRTIHALLDRGVDLYFAIKDEELGMSFVEAETFIDEIQYKPFASNTIRNRIVFGAPGTGKSFTLNKEKDALIANGGSFERVTFHPDYSYANFVGTYKPVPINDEITYSFVAGPFTRTWIEAIKSAQSDDPKPYVLLIEEINRANVAAVFGDVFQLLDRDENGVSEYPIQTSKELREYLARELKCWPDEVATIRIPSNMFIWATMNSADQGVFPMDTAFKRRWDFKYIGIDESQDGIKDYTLEIAGQKINWNALRTVINARLTSLNINEDKLIGPYFINEKTLKNNDAFIEAFKSKVIMYLFEDAAKQRRGKVFYQEGVKYSDLCQKFMSEGVKVFNPEICKNLIDTEEA